MLFRSEPDNKFAVPSRSVTGSTAALSGRVPGPGKLETSGTRTTATKATVKRAGTATIKVKLSAAGVKALNSAKSHSLKVTVRLRFTPAGGKPVSKTLTITFKRKAGR